ERVDRLVDVFSSASDTEQYATSSYPDFLDFKSQNQVFSDMLGYSPAFGAVKLTERSRLAMSETVTGNYFQVLGLRPAAGVRLVPEDERSGAARVPATSYRLWSREYGLSASVVGQPIHIHGQPYTIGGVAPRTFTGMVPLVAPELWTALTYVDDVEPGGMIS